MKQVYVSLTGLLLFAGPLLAQPTVNAVVNAASYDPVVARGGLVSIFGTGLARSTVSAASLPLPTRLEDTVVRVGDVELEAPLYFVSPTQINALLPFEVLGDRISLVVTTAAGRSPPFLLTPTVTGPGIFTRDSRPRGRALAFGPGFQPLDVVVRGEPILFYATGLGPTDPPVVSGSPGAAAEPFNRVVTVPEVVVGEVPAQVVFAGLAPGLAGVYQLNVIPGTSVSDPASDRLWIRSRGRTSNVAEVGIRPGQNVTNASGTIELLYPTSRTDGPPITFSVHSLVARFTARFDIAPSAGPFSLVALTDGDARVIVTFDPANGTFEGTVTEPTIAARVGDFSGSGLLPLDLASCTLFTDGSVNCIPFPGARIPASRFDPSELRVISLLPLPEAPAPGSATGVLRVRGEARRGSTFLIDAQNNSRLSAFGGYVTIPLPVTLPAPNQTTAVKLYIDGQRVASAEVSYRVGPF
jgi:uncharacterized protein (TIGR03437 family)